MDTLVSEELRSKRGDVNKSKFKFTIPIDLYNDKEYNNLRRSYLLLIASIFDDVMIDMKENKQFTDESVSTYTLKDIIIRIEKSCYIHTLEESERLLILKDWTDNRFEDLYRSKITRITKNLDTQSEVKDSYLFKAILSNKIDIDTISYLKSEHLSPKRSEIIIKNLKARMEQKLTYKTTKLYKCPKCKKNECTIRMVQLRSLDEGENASLRCVYCHHAWVI
jgi:DNA-directed RNA polymerase subunit M/transcription elongation factor TFIIS